MKQKLTDEQLMECAKGGDLDCISVLYDRHHVRLYNFFFYQNKEVSSAEDLLQNVFERIIKHREKYKSGVPFKAWLYKIAWNEFNDSFRKKSLVLPGDESINQIQALATTPDRSDIDDQKVRLQVAMGQLNEEQQMLINLTRYQGLRYQEVAEIMGQTESNIKVKIHRTMKALKNNYFKIGDI